MGKKVLLDELKKMPAPLPLPFLDETEFEKIWAKLSLLEVKIQHLIDHPSAGCCLSSNIAGEVNQLCVGKSSESMIDARSQIRSWLENGLFLTICDPYFFECEKKNQKSYLKSIFKLIPRSTGEIELFVRPIDPKRDLSKFELAEELKQQFRRECDERDIRSLFRETNEIHDRVWIVDKKRAFVVGTSFNGLGNKWAFILPLPDQDRIEFLKALNGIRGSR